MLFLIFVLFPTTFGLQCLFTDSDTFSSITYFQESSVVNPGNAARNTTCTHADDKCFAGSFLKLLNSTTSEYIILQMCLSDALTNIRYHSLGVNVDCNQIMPVKHTSDDLLYSYRCCDNFDCEPPIVSFYQQQECTEGGN
uniref:Sodefrin-like factor n=1 Tax=Panagrolaimus sp. JU765 TaxID=591449 RepID=A0AC34R2A2_9BILA